LVVTSDYKCDVCNKVTRIKIQVGWLEYYPIRIKCVNCKISIFGSVVIDQTNIKYEVQLKNVHEIQFDSEKPDYIIEVSGELLTEKIKKYDSHLENQFPPFFKSGVGLMGYNNIDEFKTNTTNFLLKINHEWPKIKRANELWFDKNYEYLSNEIHFFLNPTQFPSDNDLEILRSIHFLNARFTINISSKYFNEITNEIFKLLNEILEKGHSKELFRLAEFFKNDLFNYEKKIFRIISRFVEKYNFFIPILGTEYYQNDFEEGNIIKELGVTTVDFEDIKSFYIDTFEDIGEILNLLACYNNLIHRNNFLNMKQDVEKNIQDIKDYAAMRNKGKKLKFFNGTEKFDQIFVSKLNNRLRNAIGHMSYEYDTSTQKLVYYPSGKHNEGNEEVIFLNEFILECINLMRSCMGLSEIVYQTQKFLFVKEGNIPKHPKEYFL